ncbi:MAG TPA: hypothetical protein VFY92_08755 [Hyphomicrobiaceae bacterium]|nr:hypothetical protein [Hyphomicrobiaceae bacterium]
MSDTREGRSKVMTLRPRAKGRVAFTSVGKIERVRRVCAALDPSYPLYALRE